MKKIGIFAPPWPRAQFSSYRKDTHICINGNEYHVILARHKVKEQALTLNILPHFHQYLQSIYQSEASPSATGTPGSRFPRDQLVLKVLGNGQILTDLDVLKL